MEFLRTPKFLTAPCPPSAGRTARPGGVGISCRPSPVYWRERKHINAETISMCRQLTLHVVSLRFVGLPGRPGQSFMVIQKFNLNFKKIIAAFQIFGVYLDQVWWRSHGCANSAVLPAAHLWAGCGLTSGEIFLGLRVRSDICGTVVLLALILICMQSCQEESM